MNLQMYHLNHFNSNDEISKPKFFKDFINLFLERGEGREKERERNITVWLPPMCPSLGTWPATQACALTGNPLVCRPTLCPLNYTIQGLPLLS